MLPVSDDLKASHTPVAVRERLAGEREHYYLKDAIYGAIDGTVTTFAVVASAHGAGLSSGIVLILGISNLAADGFSMAISNFLGTRAEGQIRERLKRVEQSHIRLVPQGEREEVRQLFAAKGFAGPDLERAVEIITSDNERWVETMLREELGLPAHGASAWRAGAATFLAFILAGSVPLMTYLYNLIAVNDLTQPFFWSASLTAVTFFMIGALKSPYIEQPWPLAGLETLAVGGTAAGLAYGAGIFLKGLV